jgi:hypothetical protein
MPDTRRPRRQPNRLSLELPPEFIEHCKRDNVPPEVVLRGFIADLCGIMNWTASPRADGYCSNGSDERLMAREYYERAGYSWLHQPEA